MSYETVMMLLLLLLVLLLGAFLVCLFRRSKTSLKVEDRGAPEPDNVKSALSSVQTTAATPSAAISGTVAQIDEAPVGLSAAREGRPDNLQRINGVGKKLEIKLNDLGVFHYDQIAGWNRGNVVYVDNHLSFKGRIDRKSVV